jgi:hypothetical protein
VYDAIAIEESGIPTASLVAKGFLEDARSASSSRGFPGIRTVVVNIPPESSVDEEIYTGISSAMDEIVAALTRPLTPEEQSPKSKEFENASRIVFQGSLKEVNQFFYKRGWTDGLPIIPPTAEAVAEMLTGTDLPPEYLVGKIVPRLGKATVEKIAINAVMAGALPTYMPLLIAAVEALLEPRACFGTWEVSTGSWAPFWIINGPVRHDINVNCGSGALSPGDIANATIGRAMGLIIKNIGGARKGIEDMGVLGNPGKYTLVIGENEEESPWEPLHVEQGLKKEDSAITVFFPNSINHLFAFGTDVKGLLSTAVYNVKPGRGREWLAAYIIIPTHAGILARAGWTKKTIKSFISENATSPNYRVLHHMAKSLDKPGTFPLNPEDPVRMMPHSDHILIMVAGGVGNFMGMLEGAYFGDMKFITKQVKLPANWKQLADKYQGLKPIHLRY